MITMDSIPRDASGLVKGEFYLRYASDSFNESIGRVAFRNGRSVDKVGGRDLLRLVAAVGPDLSFDDTREDAPASELKPAPTQASTTPPASADVGAEPHLPSPALAQAEAAVGVIVERDIKPDEKLVDASDAVTLVDVKSSEPIAAPDFVADRERMPKAEAPTAKKKRPAA